MFAKIIRKYVNKVEHAHKNNVIIVNECANLKTVCQMQRAHKISTLAQDAKLATFLILHGSNFGVMESDCTNGKPTWKTLENVEFVVFRRGGLCKGEILMNSAAARIKSNRER